MITKGGTAPGTALWILCVVTRTAGVSHRELRQYGAPQLHSIPGQAFMGPVVATSVIFRRLECDAGINVNRLGYRSQMLIFFREDQMKRRAQYLSGLVFGLSLILSALPGHALDSARVNVTAPFDFTASSFDCTNRDNHENHAWKSRTLAIST